MSASTSLAFPAREFLRRLDRYVETEFEGNLTRASRSIGCTYDQLWNLLNGRTAAPSMRFLHTLVYHSGRSAEWWLNGETT
jgi:hypothetical protein